MTVIINGASEDLWPTWYSCGRWNPRHGCRDIRDSWCL